MKNLMLFPVFYLVTLSGPISGQDTIPEFCPKGAKWIYDSFGVVFGVEIPDNYVPYVQLVYERDTVIDGLDAKVLVESSVQIDTVIYYKDIVIRQDGWKIYFYADSAFRLLYDYSLGVGDQYTIYIDQWYMDDRNLMIDVTIDSVRDIVLNGVSMPAYYTYAFLGEFIFAGWSYFKTGNLSYLLVYDDLLCDATECAYYLRCYEDEAFSFSQRDYPCDALFTTGNIQTKHKTTVQLYPNPVRDILYLDTGIADDLLSYDIYDSLGNLVRKSTSMGESIDVSDLPEGIYFLKSKSRAAISVGQFIKIR
jgi:hypothetical protein